MTKRQKRRRSGERSPGATESLCSASVQDRPKGGRFQPLSANDQDLIIEQALAMLERIGMAGAPDWLRDLLLGAGAVSRSDGRIMIPKPLMETVITRAAQQVNLPGFVEDRGFTVGGGHVHLGTGGAAVQVLDSISGAYRDSTLADLYAIMRVLDQSPNIDYGVRPLIARDMTDPFALDINTAYACLRATGKPIGVSFDKAEHVKAVAGLFDLALGGEGAFRRQPFCMAIIVHVVPPLRFAEEGVEIMRTAIEAGLPLQICSAGQAGATSPASLAGALAQGLAESLAGLFVVDALSPGHPCIFAFMPFISDLRTGAMSGGGGEAAVASAAAVQLLQKLSLPSTACAGMTDSKIVDAQAGYEKGYTLSLAAQAGADMINLSVGMLGSIMVASPEALVIDDEMGGAILRTVRGVEVKPELLDLEMVERVVTGEGHYLGEAQTLSLMKSEYLYPTLADRSSVDSWIESGSLGIWDRAKDRVSEILALPEPDHLSKAAEQKIRERFPIKLDESEQKL